MPIKVKGSTIDRSKKVEEVTIQEPIKQPSFKKTLIKKQHLEQSFEQPLLIVNGKVKRISKDSKYLIDMLITDEE
jgi:hypothetical protein